MDPETNEEQLKLQRIEALRLEIIKTNPRGLMVPLNPAKIDHKKISEILGSTYEEPTKDEDVNIS